MTEFITKTKQSLFYWWSAWFECVILMAIAGFGCWSGATTNITAKQWVEMPMWDRHKIFVLVAVTMLSNLKSYMSSTLSELKNGKPQPTKPIGTALLLLLLVFILCGCARLNTRQTVTTITTNGVKTVTETHNTVTAFFDSRSELTKFKSLNTEKTQSVAIGSVNQETSGSNAVQTLRLIIEGAKIVGGIP